MATARSIHTELRRIGLLLVLGCITCIGSFAQSKTPAIKLVQQKPSDVRAENMTKKELALVAKMPANFHHFGALNVGETAEPQLLTLEFSAATRLTKITSPPDFKVLEGSTCREGYFFSANESCSLRVQFTPQGPGHRVGKLAITHSASFTPFYVGLGGNSYAPVMSFTPAVISVVPSTFVNKVGQINGAQNIDVDGGDSLYIADTGNNIVRVMDSSGVLKTIASSGIVAPFGIAADPFGEVFFSEPASNLVYEIFEYGSVLQLSGVGTDPCTVAAPCSMTSEKVYTPGMMQIDSGNQLFFADGSRGAAVAVVQPYPATLARLYDPFTFQTTTYGTFSVDQYDNLYTGWLITGLCQINSQTYSDAANSRAVYKKVVGGKFCGFGGDGGQARNAEIGGKIGQIAFDIAGNMYFTDTANNRVRRIDYATGIIHTIAGNGTAGFAGDNGLSTLASVGTPTGVAADSQGQVYILQETNTAGPTQIIRKISNVGALAFPSTVKAKASAAQMLTVSNSGNSVLTFTHVGFTGTNAADFSIDVNTTSCNVAVGGTLANGQSCQIGVIFKPVAAGVRTAFLTFLDNTVTNTNQVSLTGTATAATTTTVATVKFTSPSAGQAVPANTKVTIGVSVTSASGPAPKGTVTFKVDGVQVGSAVKIVSGAASISVPSLSSGSHKVIAAYSGDTNYKAKNASKAITVK